MFLTGGIMNDFEVVIGLEVHAQLLTKSKMFCSCSSDYQDAKPNSLTCPVCLGLPGSLPKINQQAINLGIIAGLATNCTISHKTKFDRKNYCYPDLMKGYQISQYDLPVATDGFLSITSNDASKLVRIQRIHLEEDVAKLIHEENGLNSKSSYIDVNRSGIALMEIVSHPDFSTPDEVITYLSELKSILQFCQVSDANMEEGNFRCDANISLKPTGSETLGTKVEIKNMNSFRSIHSAINYETQRQSEILYEGKLVVQETRGWDDSNQVTLNQRLKEGESDYMYFPEPDLPPIFISPELVKNFEKQIPTLPSVRKQLYLDQYKLSDKDADQLLSDINYSDYFDLVFTNASISKFPNIAKTICNLMNGELTRLLKVESIDIKDTKIKPEDFLELCLLIENNSVSSNMAKKVLKEMFLTGNSSKKIVDKNNISQITDEDYISDNVSNVLNQNQDAVKDFVEGKSAAKQFLIGQIMKSTSGKADPRLIDKLLQEFLDKLSN